jgi:hypothetical protein
VSEECTIQLLARLQAELLLKREVLVAPSQALEKVFMLMRGALTLTAEEGSPLYNDVKQALQEASGQRVGARSSKMERMGSGKIAGGVNIMQQVQEKPGSCIGGSKLFLGVPDIYPVSVTSSANKTVTLSIRTGDLEAILRTFGKGDSEACCQTLSDSHRRLIESMMPSAARQSSLPGQLSSVRQSHSDNADEEEKFAKEAAARRAADETALKKKAVEAAARDVLVERVSNLQSTTRQVQCRIEACKKNLDAIPNIINLLKLTGALQDDA